MSILKGKQVFVGAFLLIVFVVVFFLIHSNQSNSKDWEKVLPEKTSAAKADTRVSKNKNSEPPPPKKPAESVKNVMVDIKGAVNRPGVFIINEGSRVVDALKLAGWVTKDADADQINLAQHVSDEMVIYVPKKGETSNPLVTGGSHVQTSTGTQTGTSEAAAVHLNSATLTDLETLPGIGPSKAQAILDYRTKNGPFHTLDDLKNVTGIGEKSFERMKAQLVLD